MIKAKATAIRSVENTGETGEPHLIVEILRGFKIPILIAVVVYRDASLISVENWPKVKFGGSRNLIISNLAVRIN
jgi:hypothetical protein